MTPIPFLLPAATDYAKKAAPIARKLVKWLLILGLLAVVAIAFLFTFKKFRKWLDDLVGTPGRVVQGIIDAPMKVAGGVKNAIGGAIFGPEYEANEARKAAEWAELREHEKNLALMKTTPQYEENRKSMAETEKRNEARGKGVLDEKGNWWAVDSVEGRRLEKLASERRRTR
jgi:hypothetical protein